MIDLFAGAGGMTAGFVRAGFTPVLAVEVDADAAATYRANFGDHVIAAPIETVDDKQFVPGADVIIGGPPCQGFSPLGRMTGTGRNAALSGLWREYARVLRLVEPKAFVVENVPQFLRSQECDLLTRYAEDLGYTVESGTLNAADFGVPQRRRRAILIGSRVGVPSLPTADDPAVRTVADAIRGLDHPKGKGEGLAPGVMASGPDLHFNRSPRDVSIRRYKLIPEGGNRFDLMKKAPKITPQCWLNKPTGSTDVFGRLSWDEPSLTIRTEFFKPEKGRYLHPKEHRPITHLEASLLQGFEEDFVWSGGKISIARQIGNAVPPRLAEVIADEIAIMLAEASTLA